MPSRISPQGCCDPVAGVCTALSASAGGSEEWKLIKDPADLGQLGGWAGSSWERGAALSPEGSRAGLWLPRWRQAGMTTQQGASSCFCALVRDPPLLLLRQQMYLSPCSASWRVGQEMSGKQGWVNWQHVAPACLCSVKYWQILQFVKESSKYDPPPNF